MQFHGNSKITELTGNANNEKLQNANNILNNQRDKIERSSNSGLTSSIGFLHIKKSYPNDKVLLRNDVNSLYQFTPIDKDDKVVNKEGVDFERKSIDVRNYNKSDIGEKCYNNTPNKICNSIIHSSPNQNEIKKESKENDPYLTIFNSIITNEVALDKSTMKGFLLR